MMLIIGTIGLAILAWWVSTGLIVLAVRSFDQRHGLVMVGAAFFAALGIAALIVSSDQANHVGAITAFAGALLIWGFYEVAFLLGWVSGPRKTALPIGVTPMQRFRYATETVIHHELALAGTLASMTVALWGAANHVGVMIFALLWVMRLAAKFILFLGARHSLSELMPPRLAYLQSYFRTDRTTLLFPVVLAFGGIGIFMLGRAVLFGSSEFLIVAHVLAATFLTLALAELVLLNLPVRDSALWTWALPRPVKNTPNN
jgi:putative photosynthetic complex assembly protein 2